MAEIAIRAEGIGKRYLLGAGGERSDTLRDALASCVRSLIHWGGKGTRDKCEFWALTDASFEIQCGERVGIIGLNGAGKSTLLKILSRIIEPTTGEAWVAGRVGALLEVGTGFHWELTGRENVYLYGAILGMGKAEIDRKYEAIVNFAGVKEFMDTPVKRYSSGMYVRLAFAVAAHLEPDILLVDEVLSVGDLPFQRKCMEFAARLQQGKATLLFVSHNMFSIKAMCDRVIYLRNGAVTFDGPIEEGIKLYEEDCQLSTLPWVGTTTEEWPVVVTDVEVSGEDGTPRFVFDHGEPMRLRIRYQTRRPLNNPNFIIAFVRSDGVACCNYSSILDEVSLDGLQEDGVLELVTPPIKLTAEMYAIHVLVREGGFDRVVCGQLARPFHVRDTILNTQFGVYHEAARWRLYGRVHTTETKARVGQRSSG